MTRTARRRTKKSFLPETSFSEMVAHQDKTNSDALSNGQKGVEGNDGKGGKESPLKPKMQKELKKTDVKNKKKKLVRMINEKDTVNPAPGLNEEQTSGIKVDPTKSKHATAKKKRCRFCRKVGHVMEKCREWTDKSKICYKCGSGEHNVSDCKTTVPPGHYPFAKCFICGEIGHLSRTCSQNPRGLYPEGGGCWHCGSVEHLRTNCPQHLKQLQNAPSPAVIQARSSTVMQSADAEDSISVPSTDTSHKKTASRHKVVKF
ncbi:hypothetical protein EMCRGX_G032229 [Ephydatia muelleri]